jgi:hypothetical protein
MGKYKRNEYILMCWKWVERFLDLKMDDKNEGIHIAYIMMLEMEERKCKLVYEAVG